MLFETFILTLALRLKVNCFQFNNLLQMLHDCALIGQLIHQSLKGNKSFQINFSTFDKF